MVDKGVSSWAVVFNYAAVLTSSGGKWVRVAVLLPGLGAAQWSSVMRPRELR
jgi:hypothetical protein